MSRSMIGDSMSSVVASGSGVKVLVVVLGLSRS